MTQSQDLIKRSAVSLIALFLTFSAIAQNGNRFYPGACHSDATNVTVPNVNSSTSKTNPNPFNGNGSLGMTYQGSLCGLGYVQASVKLGQRFTASCCPSTAGAVQPATFTIAGIPVGAVIQQAYFWAGTSGNGIAINLSITNPSATNMIFPMTIVGQDQDKCWGYQGTYTYRADVTPVISGNGNYTVSGLPVDPNASTHLNDTDGGTLLIIYTDPTAPYKGDLIIFDGCYAGIGNTNTQTITGFNACANSSYADGFMIVADLQQINSGFSINGMPPFTIGNQEDWYNYISATTTVTQGQNTSSYTVNASGDCYNFMVIGLYFRTNCCACNMSNFTLTMAQTPATCGITNGTCTSTPNGGNGPYTYSWLTNPSQSGQTATGLDSGTYVVIVTDAAGCTSTDSVQVAAFGGTSVTSSGVSLLCNGVNNGTATATSTTGQSPFTYSWSNGQTNATATGLAAGTYTVTQTDAQGCTDTSIVTLTQPPPITASSTTTFASCQNNDGSATATASGGTGNLTYSWSAPGGTSTTISGLSVGSYTCTVTDANGCTQTTVCNVTYANPLTASAGPDITIQGGGSGQLNATASGNVTYSWTPSTGLSCTTCANPVANPFETTQYCVVVTDQIGCTATDCMVVNVDIPCPTTGDFSAPNAFSPNGDGHNDVFSIQGWKPCMTEFKMLIYDRWGTKVFESEDITKGWDGTYKGKELDPAVFLYYVTVKLQNGSIATKKGNVSLIR